MRALEEIERERKAILRRAQEQANELLAEANRKIENAIREIKEAQAEKERTREIREELKQFREQVTSDDTQGLMSEEEFAKKLRQMEERKARKEKRKADKQKNAEEAKQRREQGPDITFPQTLHAAIAVGDTVRIKGLNTIGKVESISGKQALVIFGDVKTKMKVEQLEHAEKVKEEKKKSDHSDLAIQTSRITSSTISKDTRDVIDTRKLNFKQDIDVRGMRGDEAINAITYYIDDAILVGVSRVRILHGTGSGILRQLIRQYLATIPNVSHFRDEHVQFGGAGITVVDLD